MGTSGNGGTASKRSWVGWAGKAIGDWTYRLYLAVGALLVILAVVFTLLPPVQAGFQTGLFVVQILNSPFRPQPWFTLEPLREEVTYPRPNGEGVADLYRIPDGQERAAVLIFLGANAAGRDDRDVINLGNALARAGFVTMFHWSPTMALQLNIDPDEIENLVWAFQYLLEQDFVDRSRVGMGGFSVGGSFAMVAATDPRIRDDVVFVNSFGAYYDARDLFLQVVSRTSFYQGQQKPWAVDRLTRLVYASEMIETLDNPQERALFTRRFLKGEKVPAEEFEGLSEQASIIHRLLSGVTLQEARELFQQLPADFRQQMARISPSTHLADLEARLLVMHDQGDLLIPVTESRRLADALEERDDFRYTETEMFEHVRPGSGDGIWQLVKEAAKLYRHMYGIISVAAQG